MARARHYRPGLIEDLHELVRRGYRQLYGRRPGSWRSALDFTACEFPVTLRRHAGLFLLAVACLFLPMVIFGIACYEDPALIYSVMEAYKVTELESLYGPANAKPGRGAERQADTDVMMFGFYILNNIGIGFRVFAGGLLLGLGSVVVLLLNGLHIGAAAGHLAGIECGSTFWPFVSGHGPYELTAIAISGTAGLLLGKVLIAAGNRTRLVALRASARDAVALVVGAALLLVLAAVVETFWSSGAAPATLKIGVGAVGWVLVALYLALAGRGSAVDTNIGDGRGA